MKNADRNQLKDILHEFIIMVVFGLGIALPVIIYNFSTLLSNVNIAYVIDSASFSAMY